MYNRYSWFLSVSVGNRQGYYKRYWARLLFGRANYFIYPAALVYFIAMNYTSPHHEEKIYEQFMAFRIDHHEIDPDAQAGDYTAQYAAHMYSKAQRNYKEMIQRGRAERHHKMRIDAFRQLDN